MFYLTMHSTHFIYGYMVSDIWLRTTQIVREETRCRYSLQLYGFEGRKEMFYLMTHSTHFIYSYMASKEGNVLFNDALNTFYLQLYGFEGRKCFI